jgi:hypothetical protein
MKLLQKPHDPPRPNPPPQLPAPDGAAAMSFHFYITLRDQDCEVTAEIEPADYSVGIMGDGLGDYTVTDEDRKPILDLTAEEQALIEAKGNNLISDNAHIYYPDGDE